jgi:nucleoside phosphorylase
MKEWPGLLQSSDNPECDVCVMCALSEEAEVFMREASRLCSVTFQKTFGSHTRREYRYATIQNSKNESLTIYVTWPPRHGPDETGLHLKPALAELKPRFAAMTGICAGNKEQAALGDIIVAERAFFYAAGKIILDKRGHKEQLYDTSTQRLHPDILQFVQMFDAWKPAGATVPRPISKRQLRDWLLNALLQVSTLRVDDIDKQELEQHVHDWQKLVHELQSGSQPYLTRDRMLRDPAKVCELHYGIEEFPFQDPPSPRCYIVPMASGSLVRSDSPFKEIRVSVRGAIAIDMEGATFYRTVGEFSGIRSLLVKGVSDYADPDKDDSYHGYAATVSALYLLCFIKEYVTDELMPRLSRD